MRTVTATRRQTVVMLTTSYPRFPGDGVGTFMEPIARGVAARGHKVHVVAPWHPLVRRPDERDVRFHFFRYAPIQALDVFGYAAALKADVALRPAAYLAAPLALAAGWRAVRRVADETGATVLHAHWVIPAGVMAAASGVGLPLVVSLHGSDVFVAEAHGVARAAARFAFRRAGWVTACSEDLRRRAIDIGADPERLTVVPYGVDGECFKPNPETRGRVRASHGLDDNDRVVVAAGRLVRKKGFDYLIAAVSLLAARWPTLTLVIAGSGDLEDELRGQATALGIATQVRFEGAVTQPQVAEWLAAADVAVVPSVRDDAGNVDGLPNSVLEALVSASRPRQAASRRWPSTARPRWSSPSATPRRSRARSSGCSRNRTAVARSDGLPALRSVAPTTGRVWPNGSKSRTNEPPG